MPEDSLGLNSFQLKWIAIVTMLTDHVGAVLFPDEVVFRVIGRIAFPIFCYLLVEGFFYTRNVHRYMLRLGIFALLSEIPYDLAFYRKYLFLRSQNVFFTLLIGVGLLYILEKNKGRWIQVVEILLAMWLAGIFGTDYAGKGILLIVIFYYLRGQKEKVLLCGAVWNWIPLFTGVQKWGVLAMPFLWLYNGERGPRMKYFFYAFYPVHLLILHCVDIMYRGGGVPFLNI